MTEEAPRNYEKALAEIDKQLGDRPKRYPSLEERARLIGEQLAYDLAYRYDSQSAAHPTAYAIEQLFEDRDVHGGIAILPSPSEARGYADPYAVAAYTLLTMIEAVRPGIPDITLESKFDDVANTLEAPRERGRAWYASQPPAES